MRRSEGLTAARLAALLLVGTVAAAAASACRDNSSLTPPMLSAVEPASGGNGSDLAIKIVGQDLWTKAEQSLEGQPTVLDMSFRAWLGETELGDVQRIDSTRLAAVVPAGLPAGIHALRVMGPWGEATLPAAFTSLAVLAGTASTSAPAVVVGQGFLATLTVQGTTDVRGVLPTLQLAGSGGVELRGGTHSALDVSPLAPAFFSFELRATQAGTVTLLFSAEGTGVALGQPLAMEPVAVTVEILRSAPALSGVVTASPAVVTVGQRITVALEVSNSGSADAIGVTPGEVVVSGDGGASLENDNEAQPQDIPAGGARIFAWTFLATQAGNVAFAVGAQGTDPFGGADPSLTSESSGTVVIESR
ncbi:MAG: hypothetical protein HY901_28330 [Deltaproteobacteria bacterium]|nr:hypothetical protein [Deltaproteobacteria bacterium]